MRLYHVTPRCNLPSILRHGLSPERALGAPIVWMCSRKMLSWAVPHIGKHQHTTDLALLCVSISRGRVTRRRSGVWVCDTHISPRCLFLTGDYRAA